MRFWLNLVDLKPMTIKSNSLFQIIVTIFSPNTLEWNRIINSRKDPEFLSISVMVTLYITHHYTSVCDIIYVIRMFKMCHSHIKERLLVYSVPLPYSRRRRSVFSFVLFAIFYNIFLRLFHIFNVPCYYFFYISLYSVSFYTFSFLVLFSVLSIPFFPFFLFV